MSSFYEMPSVDDKPNELSSNPCPQKCDSGIKDVDIEFLVSEMKENLSLKLKIKQKKKVRKCPYKIPSRSLVETNCKLCMTRQCQVHLSDKLGLSSSSEDPYQLLQELIRKGCLIQEAVKRLQNRAASKTPVGFRE